MRVQSYLAAAALLTAAVGPAGAGFQLDVDGRLSQFDPPNTLTYTGASGPGPTLTVADQYALGTPRGYFALAAPNHLCAVTVANGSGVARPNSGASISGRISFVDNQALRALLPAGGGGLDLVMRLAVSTVLSIDPINPGVFRQGIGIVNLSASANSRVFSTVSGTASATNGPFAFDYASSGALTGFGALSASGFVDLVLRISPIMPGGLDATFGVSIDSTSLSLDPQVVTAIDVGLPSNTASFLTVGLPNGISFLVPSGPSLITLPDGTPARDRGLEFFITPTVAAPPALGTPAPPALSFGVVGGAILALTARRVRRRD